MRWRFRSSRSLQRSIESGLREGVRKMAVTPKPTLIIPVENQVRELEPKLLLACVAADRGFTSIIGFRREIHFHITSFPGGIYVSKSMTAASDSMFEISG